MYGAEEEEEEATPVIDDALVDDVLGAVTNEDEDEDEDLDEVGAD